MKKPTKSPTKKTKRGGLREGAGRKPSPDARTVRRVLYLHPDTVAALDAKAVRAGVKLPVYLRRLVERDAAKGGA